MTLFEKICRLIGDKRIPAPKLPAFRLFKIPAFRWFTVGFANKHVTTVVVLAIVVSAAAVSVGLYFAIRDVVGSTYNWPEPAEYAVTEAGLQTMGKKNPDYPDGTESQTLSIRLADAARVHTMRITDTHLGRAGITRALDISPLTSAVTGATAYLFVGNLTITDSSFPTLLMETSEVANLVVGLKCDGHTMAATVTNTVSDQVLTSKRLSSEYIVGPDSIIDKIQIHITGTNGAYIENLILDGVSAWNGQAYLSRLKVGDLTINNTNFVGDGSGVDSASCQFQPSVAVRNLTSTIQDRPIKVQ